MDTAGAQHNYKKLTTDRPGALESQQLFFPFDPIVNLAGINNNHEYPLLHVNYVEVLGSSNNIQI
jgi:hypothetical protein